MFKKTLFLVVIFFLFSFTPQLVNASEDFAIDIDINYNIQDSGFTQVADKISIENLKSEKYSLEYTFILNNIDPQDITAYESGENLETFVKKDGSKTSITIDFKNKIVGLGKKRNFTINYKVENFAARTGEVWEITIPKIESPEAFRNYKVNLTIPKNFGNEAYLSPNPTKISDSKNTISYYYEKDALQDNGIVAAFGKFQVFSFILNYHLENKLNKTSLTEIAIPPETSYQKIYYENINPKPENIRIDKDGNWLATYNIKSGSRMDVKIEGSVQVFASPWKFPATDASSLANDLKPTKYWESNDENIIKLSKDLKTPEQIYDYVTKYLSYDSEKVKKRPERLGAKAAILQSKNSTCMEFTDLFIALTRAAGIPAREIEGYAYTENPQIQPLSLVNDVLHSWPEYWDNSTQSWIPVDPTWGSTSGVDYFNKFDLRHFAFVIHGNDSENPISPGSYKIGSNPQKDVYVNFGQLPLNRKENLVLEASIDKYFFISRKIYIKLENRGISTIYNINAKIYSNDKPSQEFYINTLPPYATYQLVEKIPISFLARETPKTITISALSKDLTIPPPFKTDLIFQILIIFVIITVIIFGVLYKTGKIKFLKNRF